MQKQIVTKIPFKIIKVEPIVFNYYRLYTINGTYYIRKITEAEEKLINYYSSISKKMNVPVMYISDNSDKYALFTEYLNQEDELAQSKMLLDELLKIFDKSKEAKVLKKQDMISMKKTYPVLDKYFLRLEYLIREIELKRPKNDYDWLILSKYHIILAVKMNMSQIQNKLFKLMEEEIAIEVGLISLYPSGIFFKNTKINYYLDSRVAPISEMLARFYLENNHLSDYKTKLDSIFSDYDSPFYKLHFSFIVLYILILNLNDINTSDVLYSTKFNELCLNIDSFNNDFKDYFL